MDRNVRGAELRRILESYGLSMVKGKGRIHVIAWPGVNPEIQQQVVRALRRKFQLTPENGVTDEEFYGRT